MRRSSFYRVGKWIAVVVFALGFVFWVPWGKLADSLAQPPDARQIYEMGLTAMAKGDLGAVQAAAEALVNVNEPPPYAEVLEGFVHLRNGRLRDAANLFERAREHPQTRAMANMLAGEALYRNRQITAAIDALSAAISEDPSLTDAHRRLGAILYDLGSTDAAIRELRVVSKQAADDPRPHRLMGSIFKDMESYEKAIVEYREALRRDPNLESRDETMLEFAECLLKTEQWNELAKTLQQCPPSAATIAMQAQMHFARGDSQRAAKFADEALRLDADHLEALLLKGMSQLMAGTVDEAVNSLRLAAEKHPHDFRARYQLSLAYTRLGQIELAQQQSNEFLRLRNLRERFTDLHSQAASDTSSADLRYELGTAAMDLGRPDLAISWFTAALALNPQHDRAREALKAQRLLPAKPAPKSANSSQDHS